LLQSTTTDVFGDFSFKNIDAKKTYSIDLGKNDSVPEGEPIYLAKQTGEIIKSIFRNKERYFKFEVLAPDINTLSILSVEDPDITLKNFAKEKNEKEKVIVDNIYYAQDSYTLLPEAKQKLVKIIKTMKVNKNLYLEVSSFTDSRGDDNYNLELSKKRALEVSKFIISQGIPAIRVTGNGYGETKILNRCVNGVEDCSEKEYALNRRTEFKFIKH